MVPLSHAQIRDKHRSLLSHVNHPPRFPPGHSPSLAYSHRRIIFNAITSSQGDFLSLQRYCLLSCILRYFPLDVFGSMSLDPLVSLSKGYRPEARS